MIAIDDKIFSLRLFTEKFVCDLSACKGQCCVLGDAGAPLEEEEISILKKELKNILPYMTKAGVNTVKKMGLAVKDADDELVTPLVNGKECAFTIFIDGIAQCAIEKAFLKKKTTFRKPISCHLYPIRINKTKKIEAVNYQTWDICKAAVALGKKENIAVYEFCKEPLIRKYGAQVYDALLAADGELEKAGRKK